MSLDYDCLNHFDTLQPKFGCLLWNVFYFAEITKVSRPIVVAYSLLLNENIYEFHEVC